MYWRNMRKNVWVALASVAALGVAAAAVAVMRKGKRPTPDLVLDECLRAADELETRVRSMIGDVAKAA